MDKSQIIAGRVQQNTLESHAIEDRATAVINNNYTIVFLSYIRQGTSFPSERIHDFSYM